MHEGAFHIGKQVVGDGAPAFIVAELSGNHGGNFAKAKALVRAAADAGADAVKLQTYTPESMTIASDTKWFCVGGGGNPGMWHGKTLYELYREAQTPWEWHASLKKLAESVGLVFFSTPFDGSAVAFLEMLNVPCYKVASYEASDPALLRAVAKTGKPVMVSIGLLSLQEIEESLVVCRNAGATDIALLHSTTSYARRTRAAVNLSVFRDMKERFGVVSGFSDNCGGIETAILASAAGASIIEKHLVLAHGSSALDDQFSLDPQEFKEMVEHIREGNKTMLPRFGPPRYGPHTKEEKHNLRYRRSLFVVADMKKGEQFTTENVRSIRPGFGLPPARLAAVIERRASKDIKRGTPLARKLIV